MQTSGKTYSDYREEVARQLAALRVAEPTSGVGNEAIAKRDEYLAQRIWFDSFFLHEGLATDAGIPLEILDCGRWNHAEGPDFLDARIRIGDSMLKGDVEIHLHPAGWRQHQHHRNPLYNSVILHAYLHPADAPYSTRNAEGQSIHGFAMEPFLFPDLDTIAQTVQVEDYPSSGNARNGLCRPVMCSLDLADVRGYLSTAGRERIERKVSRMTDQAQGESLDQVLYQAIMTLMGMKSSKALFFLLSKRVPLIELRDFAAEMTACDAVDFIQSIFLHTARLAPNAEACEGDTEYLGRLQTHWKQAGCFFADRIIPHTRRWNAGVRPVNFAYRRLAGIAYLLVKWFFPGSAVSTFAALTKEVGSDFSLKDTRRWLRERMVSCFIVDAPTDFWAWHFTFGSRQSSQSMKLIGGDRAESLVFNALLPVLLLHARSRRDRREEAAIWRLVEAFPALESNTITRHMRERLFGDSDRARKVLDGEERQQGLFQIFADCCNLRETGCEECFYFGRNRP